MPIATSAKALERIDRGGPVKHMGPNLQTGRGHSYLQRIELANATDSTLIKYVEGIDKLHKIQAISQGLKEGHQTLDS